MVIIALLLIAFVCLALGLFLQSSVWLVASLVATAVAGILLVKLRGTIAAPKPTAASTAEGAAAPAGAEGGSSSDAGRAAGQAVGADRAGDDAEPESTDLSEVWVVDGRPRYHLSDCAIITDQDAEAIPLDQATEDGFMPCSLCEPNVVRRP